MRKLIEYGASPNAKDENGNTILHVASEHGLVSVVEELLKYDFLKVNLRNRCGDTPLCLAAEKGKTLVVKVFLESKRKELKNEFKEALSVAVLNDCFDIVKLFLEHGVDANQRDTNNVGKTLLHYAAQEGQLAIVEELLKYGADINAQTYEGETPIHKLLLGNNDADPEPYPEQELLKVMEVLLDERYGIDLTLQSGAGLTPLETAIRLGRLKMAKHLSKLLCSEPKITDSIYPLKRLL